MIVIGSLDVGGAEMDIVRNFPPLQESGEFDVVLVLYTHLGELYKEIAKTNIRVLSFSSRLTTQHDIFQRLWEHVRRFRFIRSAVKTEGPDVIHPFLPGAYFYACLAHLFTKGRRAFVLSRLSLNFYAKKRPFLSWIEQNIFHKIGPHRFIGNAQAVLDDLETEGVPKAKLRLIYNGIETEDFTAHKILSFYTNAPRFQLTAIGNLHTYKGHQDLLVALKQLRDSAPALQWHMNIAGRDVEGTQKHLKRYIADHNLQEHISFLGYVEDRAALLCKSHLFLHPSHTEGLPNAIIEAMSAELPVIATRVGGIPELVNGATGILVSPHAPHELAQAIEITLLSPERMYHWGQAAKKKADQQFQVKHSVEKYKKLYTDLT